MPRTLICSVLLIAFMCAGTAIADSPELKGEYVQAGTTGCLNAPGSNPTTSGFDSNLVPYDVEHAFSVSFNVQGIWTFHGDGTGTIMDHHGPSWTIMATTVSIGHPPQFPSFKPGASSNKYSASFAYTVQNDGTFTAQISGLSGTFLTGGRTGQTFTVDAIGVTGLIGANAKTLTFGSVQPAVETMRFSNGDVFPRICHRAHVLVKLSGDGDN
jgi:hypothetical protein